MQRVTQTDLSAVIGSDPNYHAPSTQRAITIPDGAVAAVNQLFGQLRAIFPAWRQSFPDKDCYHEAKRIWLETLVNAGITTVQQLQVGIEQAKKSEKPFFPSVGEFVTWCKADKYAALGLPTEDVLFGRIVKFMAFGMEEADKFKFNSNAEYWLITKLYERNRKNSWDDARLKREIKRELAEMASRIVAGEQIPEPRKQLPPEVKLPITEDRKAGYIAKMRAMLRGTSR